MSMTYTKILLNQFATSLIFHGILILIFYTITYIIFIMRYLNFYKYTILTVNLIIIRYRTYYYYINLYYNFKYIEYPMILFCLILILFYWSTSIWINVRLNKEINCEIFILFYRSFLDVRLINPYIPIF